MIPLAQLEPAPHSIHRSPIYPSPIHPPRIYKVTLGNRIAMVLAGTGGLLLSVYFGLGIADFLQSPSADDASACLWLAAMVALVLLASAGLLLSAFRSHLVLAHDRIQFPSIFGRRRTLLFTEIEGRRGRGRRMCFLPREGRRLWFNESLFHLDASYRDWLATIPDLKNPSRFSGASNRSRTSSGGQQPESLHLIRSAGQTDPS